MERSGDGCHRLCRDGSCIHGVFAALALLLASIGIYGVTALRHITAASQSLEDYHYTYTVDSEIEAITSLSSLPLLASGQAASPADAANHVSQFGSTSYTFDQLGQTTTKSDAAGTTTYTWDARGRMTSARLPKSLAQGRSKVMGPATCITCPSFKPKVVAIIFTGSPLIQ